jgi:LmbE family N-acetylglucosaminyl deacetylase
MNFTFCDLSEKVKSERIDVILPDFDPGKESVTVISPHDDDALLGAGYLVMAAKEAGAEVRIMIVCDGRAGYSRIEDREGVVERRKHESVAAYRHIGVSPENLLWLDVPDFSAVHYLGWRLPGGGTGLFNKIVPLFREWKTTRLIIPNGYREHIDHTGSYLAGIFFGPQTGDAVIADWGEAPAVKSSLVYSVWADFPPVPGRELRADRCILAGLKVEEKVMEALRMFESQASVIADLVEARSGRIKEGDAIELYRTIDPRPRLDYGPYWEETSRIKD